MSATKTEPSTILFVESGESGGGSFESLYQTLRGLDRVQFLPIVAFFNHTDYVERVRSLDIECYVLRDCLYSARYRGFAGRIFARIIYLIDHWCPVFSIVADRIAHRAAIRALVALVRLKQVKILHLNNQPNRDLFGYHVAREAHLSVVSHMRSMRIKGFNKRKAQFANRYAASFLANSLKCRSFWLELGIDPAKTKVLYNALEANWEPPVDVRATFCIPPKFRWIIGCVANFLPEKGHLFLLEVFSRLRAKREDIALVFVGDGSLRGEIEYAVRKLGLDESTFLVGYVKNARRIIAGLDVLVVPSERESFGRTIIEGMDAGIPVIATAVGGIPEVINHDVDGILVAYRDVDGFVSALCSLIEHPHLRDRLARAGRAKAKDFFGSKEYALKLTEIYKAALLEINSS